MAAEAATDRHKDQVDALIRGTSYEPPTAVRDEIAKNARRRTLVQDALHELAILINEEHRKASRLVVESFKPEQEALAKEFFEHLAAAVRVHSIYGNIQQRLERAGVDSAGLRDFAKDLLGSPNARNDHASYHLRFGVKFGYIDAAEVPKGYL